MCAYCKYYSAKDDDERIDNLVSTLSNWVDLLKNLFLNLDLEDQDDCLLLSKMLETAQYIDLCDENGREKLLNLLSNGY